MDLLLWVAAFVLGYIALIAGSVLWGPEGDLTALQRLAFGSAGLMAGAGAFLAVSAVFAAENEQDPADFAYDLSAIAQVGPANLGVTFDDYWDWMQANDLQFQYASPGSEFRDTRTVDRVPLGRREVCRDGWLSSSVGRQGRCSWHGGTTGRVVEVEQVTTREVEVHANVWVCGDGETVQVSLDLCSPFNSAGWTLWPFDSDNYRNPELVQFYRMNQEVTSQVR